MKQKFVKANTHMLLAVLAGLLFSLCGCNSGSTDTRKTKSISNRTVEDLEQMSALNEVIYPYADKGFSGVVLVADKKGLFFYKAFNGINDHVDTATAFYIASNTKSFIAAAIMQLQEQGKLSVTDTITRYFKQVTDDKKNITIHQLLTHTSGLDHCECSDGVNDKRKMIRDILAMKLKNPIGSKWSYQNENYYLLAFIIEAVSGTGWQEYITNHILKPAGMQHTGFWGHEKELNVIVAPFNDSLKTRPLYNKIFKNDLPAESQTGGMFSTSRDLYRWTIALQKRMILSDASLHDSYKAYENAVIQNKNDTAIYYSYGWIPTLVKGKRINVFHAGREDWMMNNRIYMLDNGYTIIVWSMDKSGPDGDAMATVISQKLVAILEKL